MHFYMDNFHIKQEIRIPSPFLFIPHSPFLEYIFILAGFDAFFNLFLPIHSIDAHPNKWNKKMDANTEMKEPKS